MSLVHKVEVAVIVLAVFAAMYILTHPIGG